MEEIATFFTSLFKGLDIRKKWIAVAGILIVVLITLYAFEVITGYNYYKGLERKVQLLEELQGLAQEEIDQYPELYPIYLDTVEEISNRQIKPLQIPSLRFLDPVTFWKAVSGSLIWLLFAIAALFGAFGENNKVAATIMMVILAAIFGFIGAIIPTIKTPWINYIFFPGIQIILLLLVSTRAAKKKTAKK